MFECVYVRTMEMFGETKMYSIDAIIFLYTSQVVEIETSKVISGKGDDWILKIELL